MKHQLVNQLETANMLNGISLLAEEQTAKYLTVAWRILNSTTGPLPCEANPQLIEKVKWLIEQSVLNFKEREKNFPATLGKDIGLNWEKVCHQ